jgi:hypothetical protein
MIFCSSRTRRTTRRIRGRAVKALRSGRSQLCWRGFESHRMQHFFGFLLAPDYLLSDLWLDCTNVSANAGGRGGGLVGRWCTNLHWSPINPRQTHASERQTKSSLGRASHVPSRQKKVMAVPGFEPGSSGSQPLMLTTTLYHHGWDAGVRVASRRWLPGWTTGRNSLVLGGGSASFRQTIALIAQLGER